MKYYFVPPVKFSQSWELDEEGIQRIFPGAISPVTYAPTSYLPDTVLTEEEFLCAKARREKLPASAYKTASVIQIACAREVEAENHYEAMILAGYMDWNGDDWVFGVEFADIVEYYPLRSNECNEPDSWWWNPQEKIDANRQKQRCLEQLDELRAQRDAMRPSWPVVPRDSLGSVQHRIP